MINRGKNKKQEASKEARERTSPASTSEVRGVSDANVRLKVMYKNAGELVMNGQEPEFKDRFRENEPDIVGLVETKLTKKIRSDLI